MTDQYLRQQADLSPDAPFLVTRERGMTYGEVDQLVSGRARELGDRRGDQVVVRPAIDVESVVEILATTRSGATVVLIAATLPGDLAARQMSAAAQEDRPSQSILFTSGSSGTPKGVRLTPSNWEAAASVSISRLGHGPETRWLCPLPLHHVGGLGIIYRTIAAGGSVVLAPEATDLVAWMGRVHFASLVPTQLYRALESRTETFANRPVVLIGGGRSEPDLLDSADAAGMMVLPTYGMTETTSQVATARPGDPERRLVPLDGVEVRIGADDRIEVRGPTVSPGYIGGPERTPADWFTTSDRGRIEPDGALVVLGRTDRLIVTGGEKVNPAEVESEIESHPEVAEAAVVALPDREWGEVVAAAYAGEVSPDQLRSFITTRLPAHAIPKRWLQVEALPRTDLGKVDNTRLQVMFSS
ncbi:MAG TPA: AMP-binding protein [Acidimicrobiia bacterium]|nr:AMP-binding protein [Acidimicrobiia bacterium]